jgi:predicted nucleotidyltransferase
MASQKDQTYAILKARALADVLAKHNISVKSMYVFGSYASSEPKDLEYSDIDVAIVSNDFTGFRFEDNLRLIPLTVPVDPLIETHPFTERDFLDSPFAQEEIVRKGVAVI